MTLPVRPRLAQTSITATCSTAVGVVLVEAWVLMLVIGAVHGVAESVPTVGYGTALLFVIGVNWVVNKLRRLGRR